MSGRCTIKDTDERIDDLGGSSFIRDFQPYCEQALHTAGFRLRTKHIPLYLAVAETTPALTATVRLLTPYLVSALYKVLYHALLAKRPRLLASLRNRQELALLDIARMPRWPHLFGRLDTFLRREGNTLLPTVIEANFNNVEGLFYAHLSCQAGTMLAAETGLAEEVNFPSPLFNFWQWLVLSYARSRPAPPLPTVAILWEPGHAVKGMELPRAAERFRRWGHTLGIRVVTGDWRQLSHKGQQGWLVGGRPVHVIWKNVSPCYPDDLTGSDIALLSRADPSEVCVLSDILGSLLGSKWLFALLWKPETRFLFTRREWRAIRPLVPWTGEVQEGAAEDPNGLPLTDLLRWLNRHKDQLVLKPALGSHGQGVLIGKETAPDVWAAGLARAAAPRGWIAKQYVEPQRLLLPVLKRNGSRKVTWQEHYSDCNFYVLGGTPAGVLRRAAQNRVLNVAQEREDGGPAGGMLIAGRRRYCSRGSRRGLPHVRN